MKRSHTDVAEPLPEAMWPAITWATAGMIATYMLGRAAGMTLGSHSSKVQRYYREHTSNSSTHGHAHGNGNGNKKNSAFSRTVGAVMALHLFAFGAGLHNLVSIYFMRLTMGFLVGLLLSVASVSKVTTTTSASTTSPQKLNNNTNNNITSSGNVIWGGFEKMTLEHIVETGIAKIWLTGFAVSMLTSGVLYYPLCHSNFFTTMTGGGSGSGVGAVDAVASSPWSWLIAPFSFAAVIQATHWTLQYCCGRFIMIQSDIDLDMDMHHNNYTYSSYNSQSYDERDVGKLGIGLGGGDTMETFDHSDNFALGVPHAHKDGGLNVVESTQGTSSVKRRVRLGSGGNGNGNTSSGGNRSRLGSQNRSRLGSYRNRNVTRQGSYNRARLDSGMSNDVFFDCDSHCTSGSITLGFDDVVIGPPSPTSPRRIAADHYHSVAKYESGKYRCTYEDGSPAPVQAELCAAYVPTAWTHIHKSKAEEAWEVTKRWRSEQRLWKIHSMPHSKFPIIKESYSHHVHGFSKLGYPVVYEKPGSMTLKKQFTAGSLSVDDMLYHYSYFMEFLSNNLSTRPEIRDMLDKRPESEAQSHWGFMVVMDVSGMSLGILSGDVLRYLQKAGKINVSHYPNSTTMALLVNSPFWLSSAFGTIKSILPENTQADILSSSTQLEGMRQYIDDDQIPKEFGGSSPYKLGEHPFEKELQNMVEVGMNNDVAESDEVDLIRHDEALLASGNGQQHASFDIPEHMHLHTTVEFKDEQIYQDVELGQSHSFVRDPVPSLRESQGDSFDSMQFGSPHSISLRHGHRWRSARYYAEEYIFMMISVIHFVWCAAQGSLETILPVWLLSPQILGGLGYEPRRSAFALFTASVVVMWLLRSKVARCIAYIPSNAPLRGYRIGVGAEAILLLLLPFIPYISNFDSMLVLTTNALICASMFIASIVGRMSSVKLHSIASSAYINKLSLRCDTRTLIGQSLNMIADFVEKGGLSYYLGVIGEMTGALIVTPIVVWSSQKDHSFPLDASFSFYTGAALCTALYMASFSFRVSGGSATRYTERSESHHNTPMRCSILRDIIAVSVSDMASMFEENHWSSSSALGRQGMRSGEDRKYGVKTI